MTTIRQLLNEKQIDWNNADIIYHPTNGSYPGWKESADRMKIDKDHHILDFEFDNGHGGAECPRFIAKDDNFIYFPAQYDGATWVEKVSINMNYYLENETPYPGG